MVKDKETIKTEIKNHIDKEGSGYSNWYTGIATDPEKRLFEDHNVARKSWWIYREAENSDIAREIEDYFVNELGTDGDTGGGDDSTRFVYSYKKTSETNQ